VARAESTAEVPFPLQGFIHYLKQETTTNRILDLARFEREVQEGLYFQSNIPVGYGAGSSGALCAAVYERFAYAPIAKEDETHYTRLRKELAALEAFFHGASSGTDPLICYLQQPTLLMPNGQIKTLKLPSKQEREGTFFLLDTGLSRKTAPLVRLFLKKCEQADYAQALSDKLLRYNNQAIDHFLQNERTLLMDRMLEISAFQLEYFKEMIPEAYQQVWEHGLQQERYAIKLCGAGGCGFFLGYTLEFVQQLGLSSVQALSC